MDSYFTTRQKMEKLKELWYRLVAPALLRNLKYHKENYDTILEVYIKQNDELKELKKPRPLHADVNNLLRISLNHALEEQELLKRNGQIDILRQQLRQSLAYIEYLQDASRPYGDFNFNELPFEKRQEYFKRIDDQVSTTQS